MKKSYRVKKEKDFKALFDAGHSVANRKFVVYCLDRDLPHFRVIARKGVEDLSYQDIYSNLVHVLKIAKLYKD